MGAADSCCGKQEAPACSGGHVPAGEPVIMTLDEYETIRLIDLMGFTQEQCAAKMQVARTTVQAIYNEARRKLAETLVNERELRIEGGEYELYGRKYKITNQIADDMMEGKKMRIAVTYENGQIFQHFGHTEQFMLYDAGDGKITGRTLLESSGSGHGALADLLRENAVDVLICGGIGGGAQMALAEAGIRLYGGVSGNAEDAVEALLAGGLEYDPDVHCDHHGEGEAHSCGHHGEGEAHSCGHHSEDGAHGCGRHAE